MILDKISKLAPREKGFLAVGALCIAIFLLDRLVVRSVVKNFKQLDMDIEKAAKVLDYHKQVMNEQDKVTGIYNEISTKLGEVTSFAEEIDKMNMEIDNMARATGVDCPSIGPRDSRPSGLSYEEFFVEIENFQATIEDLLRFLHDVHTFPGMMRVSRLTISPDNRDKDKVKGSMLITKVMMASPEEGADQ